MDDLMGDVDQLLSDLSTGNITSSNESWATVDWNKVQLRETKASPVDEKEILGRRVFFKRDDLQRLPGSQISGNKARKMLALNEVPASEFPTCLVSYGGPQSNSMLALAAVVNYKNRELSGEDQDSEMMTEFDHRKLRFVYYTKKLPRFLRNQPSGNLFRAKSLGMELVELSLQEYKDLFENDFGGSPSPPFGLNPPVTRDSLWVPQGGAFGMALAGAKVLADEIFSFWLKSGDGQPLSVCLPGGTCSTALLLHHELKKLQIGTTEPIDIEVVVIPCVGDDMYARRQMMSLSIQIGGQADDIPTILQAAPEEWYSGNKDIKKLKYVSFGEPDKKILETFNKMQNEHGVVLDLIYGAAAWTVLLRHWDVQLSLDLRFDPHNPVAGREIMYVHSGGLEGINSQLLRYRYKGLVTNDDIQLPGKSSKMGHLSTRNPH